MALIQILQNNTYVTIPEPSSFAVELSDLDADGSGRTADGTMTRDRVAVKYKLKLEWNALTPSQMQQLLSIVSPQFFSCKFPSPWTNSIETKTMYVGDRSAPMARYKESLAGNPVPIWGSLSMDFIEQ